MRNSDNLDALVQHARLLDSFRATTSGAPRRDDFEQNAIETVRILRSLRDKEPNMSEYTASELNRAPIGAAEMREKALSLAIEAIRAGAMPEGSLLETARQISEYLRGVE